MDDLISRQAAIMDAESWVAVDEYEKHLQKKVVEWLKEFTPAKLSTNLAEVGTDCISRQAALDALNHELRCGAVINQCGLEVAYEVIEGLPPAEPETATVTIGRTKGSVTMWYKCDACDEPVDQNDNYCRNCGRKLKHE